MKLNHAIDFLCEDMKVKITLKFRGREMAHKEFGFQQVQKFIAEVAPWGHPDFEPKLIGKGINAMISPHPRNKRAKHPKGEDEKPGEEGGKPAASPKPKPAPAAGSAKPKPEAPADGFANNPFNQLEGKVS